MSSGLQGHAQKLTRAEQSRLHGFLRNVQDFGNFAVREMKEVMKDDDGAIVFVEPHDGLVQVRGAFELFARLGRVGKALLEILTQWYMPAARMQVIDRLVDGDPVNPAEKATIAIIGREVLEGLCEDLLAELASVFPVADHVQDGVEYWSLIAFHQAAERFEIASSTTFYRLSIQLFLVHEVQGRHRKVGYRMSKI